MSSEPSLPSSSSSLLGLGRLPPRPRPRPLPLARDPLGLPLDPGTAVGRLSVPGILRGRPRGRLTGAASTMEVRGGKTFEAAGGATDEVEAARPTGGPAELKGGGGANWRGRGAGGAACSAWAESRACCCCCWARSTRQFPLASVSRLAHLCHHPQTFWDIVRVFLKVQASSEVGRVWGGREGGSVGEERYGVQSRLRSIAAWGIFLRWKRSLWAWAANAAGSRGEEGKTGSRRANERAINSPLLLAGRVSPPRFRDSASLTPIEVSCSCKDGKRRR